MPWRAHPPGLPQRAAGGSGQDLHRASPDVRQLEAMLAGIPDFCAEICRSVHNGDMTWTMALVGHPQRRAGLRDARGDAV